jgi:heme exporter protein D
MTAPPSPSPWWAPFVPVISLLVLIAGAVLASGGYLATLKDNTRRIEQLETDARTDAKTRTEMLQQLDLRLARIEVKLEMMAPPKSEKMP